MYIFSLKKNKLFKTLFLDRDGVINRRLPGSYVGNWEQFEILPGVLDAIPLLNSKFDRIVLVTNQAGIAKGLIKTENVEFIHARFRKLVQENGGLIHSAFFCPHHPDELCPCRKPQPGMAYQAKAEFPDIQFENAVMVGDSASDLVFGLRLGMQIIEISGKQEDVQKLSKLPAHQSYDSLFDFASSLH